MRVIAGKARRLNLKTIPGTDTRPTTDRIKETLFNILQPELLECRFLDLFAGSGGIGIEALSRGASYAVFVEKNPKAAACIRENLAFTKLAEDGKLLNMDVLQALRSLEGKGLFDIIFMDIQMPKLNGYDATRAIRAMNRDYCRQIPIIAMTANAFAEDVQAAKTVGMNEHIAKPLDMNMLAKTLRRWLQ